MSDIPPVDKGQAGIQVVARFAATLDRMDAREERRAEIQRRAYLMAQPVFYYPGRRVTILADGTAVQTLGGPDMGHIWMVRSLVAGGVTPTTVVPGQADIFISAGVANTGQVEPSILEWRDRATSLPTIGWYSSGEMVVKATEKLIVRFSGATVDQEYLCAARVMDLQEGAASQNWDI